VINPIVVDVSHYQSFEPGGLTKLKGAGYYGVIHKADQGSQRTDSTYPAHRAAVLAAGLAHGAYHFNNGDDVAMQVAHFFKVATPDANTLMALDFEDNRAGNMTIAQALEFLKRGDDLLGRPLWIYSGNRMKDLIPAASDDQRDFLAIHPLWGCEYGPLFKMFDVNGKPLPWTRVSLWQFTGDGVGPEPHSAPGIIGTGIDINSYSGTPEELAAEWLT
jgi:GH25 family lysozyme M1 (1,4-beta-N-acetylmuramidase)